MSQQFVHLHNHSEYSLLDGANKIKNLVNLAVKNNMPAVALTDHGNMSGAVEFATRCKEAGIKPLVGMESYTSGDRRRFDKDAKLDKKNYHLILLAQNEIGYKNLIKLTSRANTEGFYYKPRIDHELLSEHSEGIIATSACLGSEICQYILNNRYEHALKTAATYRDIMTPERFFIELQDHGQEDDKIANPQLINIAKELGLKTIATNDIHYGAKVDANPHDTLLCIGTNAKKYDIKRMRYPGEEFYFKTYDEMEQIFPDNPDALSNTCLIADMVDFELKTGDLILPHFEVPEGETYDSWFDKCCWERAHRILPNMGDEYTKRLLYEIDIIKFKGYSAYFLIVEDFVRWAHERDIPARCRGSAAGSLVSYVLGISNVDPLKYGLMFERFFYKERISPPDIDLDFADYRRQDVVEYCRDKYGKDHVANIITFGSLGPKTAIRDVSRVLGISLSESGAMSKMVPVKQGKSPTIDQMLGHDINDVNQENMVQGMVDLYKSDGMVHEVLDTVHAIEGLARHPGVHAAGIVITPGPVEDYAPVQVAKDGSLITQYDMNNVSAVGLLKMDFLGLRTLTVVEQCLYHMKQNHPFDIGDDFDINKIPENDPKTFRLLQSGQCAGVFQLESSGMQRLVVDIRPDRIDDIIPLVALYRPGPMEKGTTKSFVERRHGREGIEYLHPSLEPILKDTYGLLVYQDQILRICIETAGMSALGADNILKAMGKKKQDKMDAQKPEFIKGVTGSGFTEIEAETLWDIMAEFAKYAFNKSHAAAYAVLSYQTAWLKANYPIEFMAALLTSVYDNTDKVVLYVDECRRMGIPVRAPDVNKSLERFSIDHDEKNQNGIRFGLLAIHGIGEKPAAAVINARSTILFSDLFDFCMRINIKHCQKSAIEIMIKAGAFDSLHPDRAIADAWLETSFASAQLQRKDKISGQTSLFDNGGKRAIAPPVPTDIDSWTERECLRLEKEMLGFYVSGHPLYEYEAQLKRHNIVSTDRLSDFNDEEQVLVAGLVTEVKIHITKAKHQQMAFVTIEDTRGKVAVTIFPKTWERLKHLVFVDAPPVVMLGKVQYRDQPVAFNSNEDEINEAERTAELLVDDIVPIDEIEEISKPAEPPTSQKIHDRMYIDLTEASDSDIERIKSILNARRGDSELVIRKWGKETVSVLHISATQDALRSVSSIVGRHNTWLK